MGNNRTSLDWFEFTYHAPDDVASVLDYFFLSFPEFHSDVEDSGVPRDRGCLNYACCVDVGYAYVIMWHPLRPEMGVHVRFPGSAIPLLCGLFNLASNDGWALAAPLFDLFYSRIDEFGGRIKWTRIDIAFDDFDRVFTPADYIKFQFENRIRSKCKTSQMNFSALQSPDMGSTWYLGSRSGNNHSTRLLRVYDKNYQSKGRIKSIRYELELHGKYADAVIKEIREHSSTLLFGDIIQDMFVVLDPLPFDGTTKKSISVAKSRASVCQMWLSIFETQVSRRVVVHLPSRVPIDTFARLSPYLENTRRSWRIFLDTVGEIKTLEFIRSVSLRPNDIELLRKCRSEVFYEYQF